MLQPQLSDLHLHLVSCSQLSAMGGSFVQTICHSSPVLIMPQLVGVCLSGWRILDWLQMQSAWLAAYFTCCFSAARAGGITSHGLCFQENMSNLASSTPSAVLDLSYIITTNFFEVFRSLSSTTGGYLSEDAGSFTINIRGLLSRLLLFATECWNNITPSERIEEEHPSGFVFGHRQPTTTANLAPEIPA